MTGYEFVEDLYATYGLLEGYRKAEAYLETPFDSERSDKAEERFRDEIKKALWQLDQI